MSGVRIYELAKELGVPSKKLIDILSNMGYPVKSHSSSIDNYLADRVRRQAQVMGLSDRKKKPKPGQEKPVAEVITEPEQTEKPSIPEVVEHIVETKPEQEEIMIVAPVEEIEPPVEIRVEEKPEPAPAPEPVPVPSPAPIPAPAPAPTPAPQAERMPEIKTPPPPPVVPPRPAAPQQQPQAFQPHAQRPPHQQGQRPPQQRPGGDHRPDQRRDFRQQDQPRRGGDHTPRPQQQGAPQGQGGERRGDQRSDQRGDNRFPPRDNRDAARPRPDNRPRDDNRPRPAGGAPAAAVPDKKHHGPAEVFDKSKGRGKDPGKDRADRKREDEERRRLEHFKRKEQDEARRKALQDARRKEDDERRRKDREQEAIRRKAEEEEREIQRLIDEEERVKREAEARRIVIDEATTVKEFAEKLRVGVNEIIKKLISKGIMATLNQTIDGDVARELALDMGYEIKTREEEETEEVVEEVEDSEHLQLRPPVVTIMGHVDHGKTSLLDTIRKTRVTEEEAGGITQRIGAYSVKLPKGRVVFLDTPGHEAFTAMRYRGAAVTDIVVLVVAADDGVMPQTVEAIHHAKAANVPVLVAINKIDKPGSNPDKVKQELAAHDLVQEEWGGTTIFCEVSAKKQIGIDNLLELLLLQAEILELKANPHRPAYGAIIESKLDKGRGPVATVLVQKGSLKIGDPFVSGTHYGKVRALIDDTGKRIDICGPSTPVEVLGFSGVPTAGETFMVVDSERKAHQISISRQNMERQAGLAAKGHVKLENLHAQITKGNIRDLNIIIKSDVQGSIEAVKKALEDISVGDVRIRVLHGAVGGITETDIALAAASDAIVIGFNVRPTEKARSIAEAEEVDVRLYSIIYNAVDDIKAALEGMLAPEYVEKITGRAEVRETFNISKIGTIAGCMVTSGKIVRNNEARLVRDNVVVFTGKLNSLKRFKDDAREVMSGYECGIGMERYNDLKKGDIIETFLMEKVERKS